MISIYYILSNQPMATAIVSSSDKQHRWFSPKSYFKSNPKSKPNPEKATPDQSPAKPRAKIIEEYRTVFSHFDTDGDGNISSDELRSYFASVGETVSCFDAVSECLDFHGFVELMESVEDKRNESEDDQGDLKMAFEMFEADKGSGFITPKGLQMMLSRLGDSRSYRDCESMIRAFDLDSNGVLDFHEFVLMMTSN